MTVTFSDIQTRIQRYVIDDPDAMTTDLPSIVNDVVLYAQQEHNFKCMEAQTTLTTTSSTHTLGTISDFKEIRDQPWYLNDDGTTKRMYWAATRVDLNRMWADDDDGDPCNLYLASVDAANVASVEVYPESDGASDYTGGQYRVVVPYWKYLPALSYDTDTNWFLNNATEYVLFAAVARAFAFNLGDQRSVMWEARATQRFQALVKRDKRGRSPRSSVLHPRLGVFSSPRSRGL